MSKKTVYSDVKCQSCGQPVIREDYPDKSWSELCFHCGMEHFGLAPIESFFKIPKKHIKKLIAFIDSKLNGTVD